MYPVVAVVATLALHAESPRFSRDILPILSDHCFACHGPDAQGRKGGLRLDTSEAARAGGKSDGPAVVPGKPESSALHHRIRSQDPESVMPPPSTHKPLSIAQKDLLDDWIRSGAAWGKHWAYEPVVRPIPSKDAAAKTSHPIDAFVQARLRREGLPPAAEAGRATLLRRVTLDLTGLPPTPSEVEAFITDTAPDAYERRVDLLLASPRHGERMAWEWLEAARYADSNGYQGDGERTMWPWRDWVVSAMNRNLPFDTFSRWQMAGDLLPSATREQRLATGFVRNHPINGEGGRIAEENRIDYLFDQVETVGTVWLAATFNCTRCHDHKFDPLTQSDYFRLVALFNRTSVDGGGGNPQTPPVLAAPSAEQDRILADAETVLESATAAVAEAEATTFRRPEGQPIEKGPGFDALPNEVKEALRLPPAQRNTTHLGRLHAHFEKSEPAYDAKVTAQLRAMEHRNAVRQSIPKVMVMEDTQPRDTFMLVRGLYNKPGARVEPGLPEGLFKPAVPGATNRLQLADWLLRPEHPLTARVIANRQWQLFFGTGLVKTAEDFGLQGERPLHLDLLDWLAAELVASGWDIKALQRRIVTSATYRQSSRVSPDSFSRDPENRLLSRGPRHRLPSWMLRDVALAAAGLLVEQVGGAPVRPYQPDGVWEEATFGGKTYRRDTGAPLYRRSLYTFWRRIVAPTLFFDVASRQTCTVRNPRTNTPLQALLLLNDTTFVEAARVLAGRLCAIPSPHQRIEHLFQRVLNRAPSPAEFRVLENAVGRHRASFESDPEAATLLLKTGDAPNPPGITPAELAAWTLVCSTVLNLDEALSKE